MTGSELRQRRLALRMTGRELAATLRVTSFSISRWENGHWPVPEMVSAALDGLAARILKEEATA